MQTYIGTKLIKAKPMTRIEYNEYRGWDMPKDEDPNEKGMLVEYADYSHPNHPDHAGYISWAPMSAFPYERTTGMNFGLAIEAMKMGKKVARAGWNGKGMFIYYRTAGKKIFEEVEYERLPYFVMKTADDKLQAGWLASQSDMDAQDWTIVD